MRPCFDIPVNTPSRVYHHLPHPKKATRQLEEINSPIPPILIPTPTIIRPVPAPRRHDDDVARLDVARPGLAKAVDGLHNHLLAAGVAARPRELVALAAGGGGAHGGEAVAKVVRRGDGHVAVAEVAVAVGGAAAGGAEAVGDGVVVYVAYFGGASWGVLDWVVGGGLGMEIGVWGCAFICDGMEQGMRTGRS